ncbi:serine/threonine protein kinase, CMGC, CDC2/CDK sub [Rhodotorula toruloides]
MSNRQVPPVYRSIITDVTDSIRPEFDQLGIEEAVLQELVRLWELRLAQSRVADFTSDERMEPVARQFPMVSLQEKEREKKAKRAEEDKLRKETKARKKLEAASSSSSKSKPSGAGADDEEDDGLGDEDAINSDLDDDDDDDLALDEEEGEQGGGDFVLALYEKVQRVKNKWKVTLKDGLASVNGREFIFAKCQGWIASPPPPPPSSAQPSTTTTTAAGAKTVPGQKRPRFSMSLAAAASAAASSSASASSTASPRSPAKRVTSGGTGTVGRNVFAMTGKGKEREKEGKKEAGEVDEEDVRALEELRRSTTSSAGAKGRSASPTATRGPSLPPKPILGTSPPPSATTTATTQAEEGEEADFARRRVSEGNSYQEKMKRRERSVSVSAGGGREEGEEGEVRSRSGQRESWRAADERPSGSAGYANGHGYAYGNGYGRGDRERDRRDSYGGPSSRSARYDSPRDYRASGRNESGPDYWALYDPYGDQGGLPYDQEPAPSSSSREPRRHDDRRRERDDYGNRDDRRGDYRRIDDRNDRRREERWQARREDDRSSSRRDHRDDYARARGYERRPVSYGDDDRDDDRHHPSKRHKSDRSPPPRRARSRDPSRSPISVHDSPSESGTPVDPYKEKSVLDPRHLQEFEERVRSGNVRRDEGATRNGAMQDPRDRYVDRSAPPPPPPPHQQHHQHYPPPPPPPSHLPPQPAFVPQAGFPPPPPPPALHSSFIRPEPIHAPPHTAVPAGSRPASQPSESINPSPAVGAPAPSTSRDTASTPVSSLQPTSSALHVDPLPLNIRSNRSAEELWVREMNDAEVDELITRARAESSSSAVSKVERKYVGCSHISEYSLNEKLGEGTFGVVWKGMRGGNKVAVSAAEAEKEKEEEEKLVKVGLRVRKGDVVALKQIIFHNEGDGLPITSVREIRILKMLDHPNVVPVVDIAYEPADAQNFTLGKTFMVFPYMDHDLAGLLENPRVKLETEHIKQYSKQLLEGTAYLHRNRILHRDMKAANLLINNKGQLMIADFGLARSIEAFAKNVEYTSCVVTRWYRPPELLLGEKRYHTPVDMWGVGCIMAEMWHRSPIFPGSSDMDQAVRIFASCGPPTDETMPGWRSLPGVEGHETVTWANNGRSVRADWAGKANDDLFGDLMDRILVLDPKKRLTATEALDHDWFWTEPFPCDPSRMPTYEASHELDRRKRVQDQHAAFGQPVQQMQQPMHARPAMPGYGNPPPQQPYSNQHALAPFNGPPPPAAFNGPPVAAYNAPHPPMANPYNAPAQQPYGGGGMGGMAGGGPHRSYAAAGPPVATVGARPMNGAYEPMRPSWQSQQARPTYGAPPAQAGAGRGGRVNLVQRLAKKQ